MNKLKLIISFILLVSLFLGVVACTPDEESKAESSADVSESVSEENNGEISFIGLAEESYDKSIGKISDDQIVVWLHGGKKILDRYIDSEILAVVTMVFTYGERDTAFKNKYGYDLSETYNTEGADKDKIESDMAELLIDLRREKITEFYDVFSIETDEFSFREACIFHLEDAVLEDWIESTKYNSFFPAERDVYHVSFIVTLTEDEIEIINENYIENNDNSITAKPLWDSFLSNPSGYYYCPPYDDAVLD